MRSLKTVLAFFLLAITANTTAQNKLSDEAFISLLTCGPGNELYSVFGHTAIRVYDPATKFDVVYNFGAFDFDTPNFYGKFVKGDLQYFVSTSSYEDFVYTYVYYDRDVYEQVLNLTQTQTQAIADELNNTLLDDNKRFYTYKFIHRNCTTMVADIINKHVTGSISLKNSDQGMTYREIIYSRLIGHHFYENLGIHLTFGYPTDAVSQKLFLPNELMEGVGNTATSIGPLAKKTMTVYTARGEKPFSWWNNIYTLIAVCAVLIALSHKQAVQRSFLAIFGLLGIFFAFVHFYSLHSELVQNYNVLLVNPLFLVLLYFVIAGKKKAVKWLVYACMAMMGIYIVFMVNKPHLLIVLPLIVLTAVMLLRVLKSNK